MKDIRCWLGFHDWVCERTPLGECSRCGKLRKMKPEEFKRFMEAVRASIDSKEVQS